eukprot:616126-Rhodomonas_salina.3
MPHSLAPPGLRVPLRPVTERSAGHRCGQGQDGWCRLARDLAEGTSSTGHHVWSPRMWGRYNRRKASRSRQIRSRPALLSADAERRRGF